MAGEITKNAPYENKNFDDTQVVQHYDSVSLVSFKDGALDKNYNKVSKMMDMLSMKSTHLIEIIDEIDDSDSLDILYRQALNTNKTEQLKMINQDFFQMTPEEMTSMQSSSNADDVRNEIMSDQLKNLKMKSRRQERQERMERMIYEYILERRQQSKISREKIGNINDLIATRMKYVRYGSMIGLTVTVIGFPTLAAFAPNVILSYISKIIASHNMILIRPLIDILAYFNTELPSSTTRTISMIQSKILQLVKDPTNKEGVHSEIMEHIKKNYVNDKFLNGLKKFASLVSKLSKMKLTSSSSLNEETDSDSEMKTENADINTEEGETPEESEENGHWMKDFYYLVKNTMGFMSNNRKDITATTFSMLHMLRYIGYIGQYELHITNAESFFYLVKKIPGLTKKKNYLNLPFIKAAKEFYRLSPTYMLVSSHVSNIPMRGIESLLNALGGKVGENQTDTLGIFFTIGRSYIQTSVIPRGIDYALDNTFGVGNKFDGNVDFQQYYYKTSFNALMVAKPPSASANGDDDDAERKKEEQNRVKSEKELGDLLVKQAEERGRKRQMKNDKIEVSKILSENAPFKSQTLNFMHYYYKYFKAFIMYPKTTTEKILGIQGGLFAFSLMGSITTFLNTIISIPSKCFSLIRYMTSMSGLTKDIYDNRYLFKILMSMFSIFGTLSWWLRCKGYGYDECENIWQFH